MRKGPSLAVQGAPVGDAGSASVPSQPAPPARGQTGGLAHRSALQWLVDLNGILMGS